MGQLVNIVGMKFNRLLALEYVGDAKFKFECDCGTITIKNGAHVRRELTKSCGCLHNESKLIHKIQGQKFGKLTALEHISHGKWVCQCDCGETTIASGSKMISGHIRSCGCLGRYKDREDAIIARVYKINRQQARHRGKEFNIKKEDFKEVILQPCHYCGKNSSKKYTDEKEDSDLFVLYNGLDRVDNNKGYLIDNVVSCCKICNRMKQDLTLDDFRQKIIDIYNNLGFQKVI